MIPKRFIRVWLGNSIMPAIFEKWWDGFKEMHPDYEFVTINNNNYKDFLLKDFENIFADCQTYSGQSDVLRYSSLHLIGGVYIDTDVMPLKPFDDLISSCEAFAGLRSKVSFEAAIIGAIAKSKQTSVFVEKFHDWYRETRLKSNAISTGPGFLSRCWFGREDVKHLPIKTFYPYNGFMAPNKEEKRKIFQAKIFPPEMIAAHFSNHKWGGKPKNI